MTWKCNSASLVVSFQIRVNPFSVLSMWRLLLLRTEGHCRHSYERTAYAKQKTKKGKEERTEWFTDRRNLSCNLVKLQRRPPIPGAVLWGWASLVYQSQSSDQLCKRTFLKGNAGVGHLIWTGSKNLTVSERAGEYGATDAVSTSFGVILWTQLTPKPRNLSSILLFDMPPQDILVPQDKTPQKRAL